MVIKQYTVVHDRTSACGGLAVLQYIGLNKATKLFSQVSSSDGWILIRQKSIHDQVTFCIIILDPDITGEKQDCHNKYIKLN